MSFQESGIGKAVLIGAGILLAVVMIVLDQADVPPVSWINEFQASLLGGRYYPKLTFLILMLLALIPFLIVAGILNALRGGEPPRLRDEGRRSARYDDYEEDDEDERRPPRRRLRRDDWEEDDPPPRRRLRRDEEEEERRPLRRRSRRDEELDEDRPTRRNRVRRAEDES